MLPSNEEINGAGTAAVTVVNVAPTFEAGPDETLQPSVAGAFSRTRPFTDPGADAWSGTVNYGDGTGDQPLLANQAAKTFDLLLHTYTEDGTFTVTVNLTDGESASVSDTFDVTVILNTPPAAKPDSVSTNEDGPVVFNVLADNGNGADSDAEGNIVPALTVELNDPATGVLTNNGSGSFTFDPNGAFESLAVGESASESFDYQIEDTFGETATATVTITINGQNDAPTADDGALGVNEDDGATNVTATLLAGDTDPDTSDTLSVSAINTTGTIGIVTLVEGVVSYNPNGQFESLAVGETANTTFGYTLSDGNGGTDTATVTVTITGQNDAPESVTIIQIGDGSFVFPIGTVSFAGSFTDADSNDTHTAVWTFTRTVSNLVDTDVVTGTVNQVTCTVGDTVDFSLATFGTGVYTVTLTVDDGNGGVAESASEGFVIYDPSGGFVTGGGWIDSPAGADTLNPLATGKATFGFVSKYKKGTTTPTGQTEFRFKAGDLNFHSTSYDWLVVAGARA